MSWKIQKVHPRLEENVNAEKIKEKIEQFTFFS